MTEVAHDLEGLLSKIIPPLGQAGVAVARGGRRHVATRTASGLRELRPDSLIRVASISKIVTGQLCLATATATATANVPVAAGPGRTVALTALLSHTSGLRDTGGYVVGAGGSLDDLLARADWGAPRFEYCNLGYMLAADAVLGERFGAATTDWLKRHAIPGGFNWHGVGGAARRAAMPCLRRTAQGFAPQVDGPVTLPSQDGPQVAGAPGFAPQGGLRTSLAGCLTLAEAIPRMDLRVLSDPGPPHPTDLFDQYGAGVMMLRRPSFYPRPLIGHFANAYGLCGGVWHDARAKLSFAYLLNGLPEGDEDDALRAEERAIFACIAALA